jgi:hypothetical protein
VAASGDRQFLAEIKMTDDGTACASAKVISGICHVLCLDWAAKDAIQIEKSNPVGFVICHSPYAVAARRWRSSPA